MQKRELGRSGIVISPVMLGGNVFGWTVDQATAFTLLDAFVEAGFDAIDTADVYSRWIPGNIGGESEAIIGAWMKARGSRHRVMLATKGGSEMGPGKAGLSKAYIVSAVEDSLRRLQTDYIDLYQTHRDDPNTPLEETLEALATLVGSGKLRILGASNYAPARMREALDISRAHHWPRFETLQPRYNLYDRGDYEGPLQQLCAEENVSCIPFYGLASGFLTGKYRAPADFSKSARGVRMGEYLTPRGLRILAALDVAAAEYQTNPAAIALAWLMAQRTIAAPIASITHLSQMESFSTAAGLTLSRRTLTALDAASTSA